MNFTTNVIVEVSKEGAILTSDNVNVIVPYTIEIEYRSWGIKDIGVYFNDKITVPYTELVGDDEVDHEVEVDLNKLNHCWFDGGAISITDINLYLDTSGNVDYKKSEIELIMIKK